MPFSTPAKEAAWRLRRRDYLAEMKRRWREANPEKVRAMKRRHYLKYKAQINAKSKRVYRSNPKAWYDRVRKWKAGNKDKELAYQRKWARANKVQISARMKTYHAKRYAENSDLFKLRALLGAKKWQDRIKARRRTRLITRATEDRLQNLKRVSIQLGQTEGDPAQIVQLIICLKSSKDTKCRYCGVGLFRKKMHIDHIIPLSRGGKHSINNLCASCPPCNLSKSNKTVEEWEQWKRGMRVNSMIHKELQNGALQ